MRCLEKLWMSLRRSWDSGRTHTPTQNCGKAPGRLEQTLSSQPLLTSRPWGKQKVKASAELQAGGLSAGGTPQLTREPFAKAERALSFQAFKRVPINITVSGYITIASFQGRQNLHMQSNNKVCHVYRKKINRNCAWESPDTEFSRQRLKSAIINVLNKWKKWLKN